MNRPTYIVQCMAGHVSQVPHDSDLEKRCIEHEKKGYIDALCLSHEECPDCQADQEMADDRFSDMCALVGCPLIPPCQNGCMAHKRHKVLTLGGNRVELMVRK